MQQQSSAQRCALLLGVVLVVLGIVGFFYNGTFTSNEAVHDDMLGIFAVNGWSNTLHVLLGVWGLMAASSWLGARIYGYAAGLFLIGVAVWGFVLGAGQSILSIVPVNTADDVLHLGLGIVAVLGAVASSPEPDPTTLAATS
ncbi:MAG TPA: DUF4383 domain-containing protein [Thermoleophilaceae bacterium]